jgi:hypothetical protein
MRAGSKVDGIAGFDDANDKFWKYESSGQDIVPEAV